jgi:hypothetical protein
MFGTTLGRDARALNPAAGITARLRARSDISGALLLLVFAAVTATLFFAWLSSWNMGPPIAAKSPPADCTSLGRGGLSCAGPSATGGHLTGQAYSRPECISAGRGGLVCNEGPAR